MNVTIKIEGLSEFTEAITLLGSSIAHHNGMENTVKAFNELNPNKKSEIKEKAKKDLEEITKNIEKPVEIDEVVKESSLELEDVRALFVSKNSPGTRDKLKAILVKYGADNISSLKKEHFESVVKDLDEL